MHLGIKTMIGAHGSSIFGDGTYNNSVYGNSLSSTGTTPTGTAAGATYLYVAKGNQLPAGYLITHICMYESRTRTVNLFIMRCNAAGSYTAIKKLATKTTSCAASGYYQEYALSTPYIVPSDGYGYYIGTQQTAGDPYYVNGQLVAYRSGNMAEGDTLTGFTETAGGVPLCGYKGGGALTTTASYTFTGPSGSVTVSNAIVITGGAVINLDSTKLSSVLTCNALVVNGSGATLCPAVNSKGMIIAAKTGVYIINSGKIHADKLGYAGTFSSPTVLSMIPDSLQSKFSSKLSLYSFQHPGAAGGAGVSALTNGNAGANATVNMQTGGGGSGGASNTGTGGAGGYGGAFCGGAGGSGGWSDTGVAAGNYGGPAYVGSYSGGPGAGHPSGGACGRTDYGTVLPTGGGGGSIFVISPYVYISSGSVLSSIGGQGGYLYYGGITATGGSAGGGAIGLIINSWLNNGSIGCAGGASVAANQYTPSSGGAGGVGSTIVYTV